MLTGNDVDLLVLIVLNGVFFLAAYVGFLRFDLVLILAKWLGGYFSLALPFLAALLIGALLISMSAEVPFTATDWEAFAVTGIVSLLLLAVMFSIGLLVSVRARSSSTAILSLVALWVLLALVVPNLGPYLAELAVPVPDVGAVEREIGLRTEALTADYRSQWRRGGRSFRNMRDQLQEDINEVSGEIISDFENRLRRQTDMARVLTRISPVACFVFANTDLGATGVRHEERLIGSLRQYQRQFARYVAEQREAAAKYDIDDLPDFRYRTDGLQERLDARLVDVLLLALFAVAFFMAAFVSFLRSEVN